MRPIVRVALPVPVPKSFDYWVPEGQAVPVQPMGCRIQVPFGKQEKIGVVVAIELGMERSHRLKTAGAWLDQQPCFTDELWATLNFAARYYAHPLGEVLHAALPRMLRLPRQHAKKEWQCVRITEQGRQHLPLRMARMGVGSKLLLQTLEDGQPHAYAVLRARVPGCQDALRRWLAQGWIERVAGIEAAPGATVPARLGPPLNQAQLQAVQTVSAAFGRYRAFLLDGVTGSGKTEVYIELIQACVAKGLQALVLVPEIGLTPQALLRYQQRLGVPIHALHSGLPDGARYKNWLAARTGAARVVLGTRSAVFAPLKNAGLIIVDEEHDLSYKQQEGFRYSARDLAVVRARALGVPIVLGSATPAFESLANAQSGRYQALRLPVSAQASVRPSVRIIDMRQQAAREGLSQPMLEAMRDALARGERVLVFRNRRGYAPLLMCHACGWQADCPHCEAHLVFHRTQGVLRCHHCGYARPVPPHCPACSGRTLRAMGVGTERIEQELAERFPAVPLWRIDRDTQSAPRDIERVLALAEDQPAILIGTQMLAKGHDLPGLTLVCVVGIDEGLFSADFRGPERLAQLLVQVAGRTGRGTKASQVVLQTHHPQHPLFQLLHHRAYGEWAEEELKQRKALALPPYTYMALLRAESKHQRHIDSYLVAASESFRTEPGIAVRGPFPPLLARRAGHWRGQLVLESPVRATLQKALDAQLVRLYELPGATRVRWALDIDPLEMG